VPFVVEDNPCVGAHVCLEWLERERGRSTFPGMKWFEMDIPSGGTRRIRLDGTAGLKRVPEVRGK